MPAPINNNTAYIRQYRQDNSLFAYKAGQNDNGVEGDNNITVKGSVDLPAFQSNSVEGLTNYYACFPSFAGGQNDLDNNNK